MTTTEMEKQLRASGAIFEVPIETREIMEDFVLLTYDIPNDEKGQKARYEFLKDARRLGLIQHTESVYLGPWTHDFNMAAIQVAGVGKVYVWYAKPDPGLAEELTRHYDFQVSQWLDDVDERLERIAVHIQMKKLRLAGKMVLRTIRMLDELAEVIKRRGSARLWYEAERIRRDLGRLLVQVEV